METKRPPDLGSIEWRPLPEGHGLPATTIGIRHVGPRAARRWSRQIQRLRREEDDRIRCLRRAAIQVAGEDAAAEDPALFADPPKYQTPEADEAYEALFDDLVAEAVAGLDSVEDSAYARRLLEYLAPGAALELIVMILDQQSLSARQSFHTADPGVAQSVDSVSGDAPALGS